MVSLYSAFHSAHNTGKLPKRLTDRSRCRVCDSLRRFGNSRKVKFPLLGDLDILVSFIPTSPVESGTRIR
jgi:hypothetical protein